MKADGSNVVVHTEYRHIMLQPYSLGQGVSGWRIHVNGISVFTESALIEINGETFSCKFLYENAGEDYSAYCKTCREYEHGACSNVLGCPCCEREINING